MVSDCALKTTASKFNVSSNHHSSIRLCVEVPSFPALAFANDHHCSISLRVGDIDSPTRTITIVAPNNVYDIASKTVLPPTFTIAQPCNIQNKPSRQSNISNNIGDWPVPVPVCIAQAHRIGTAQYIVASHIRHLINPEGKPNPRRFASILGSQSPKSTAFFAPPSLVTVYRTSPSQLKRNPSPLQHRK